MNIPKISAESSPSAKSRVDDSGLRQFAGYHLKRAYNVLRSDLAKKLEPLGLRITTYSSLILIVDNPGIRQSELAAALDIERPNMVVILDDLEQKGWINRERLETDRRAYALFATLTGKRVCEKAVQQDRLHEAKVLGGLEPKEIQRLIEALNKIEQIEGK